MAWTRRLGHSSQEDGRPAIAEALFRALQRQNSVLADHPHAEQYTTLQVHWQRCAGCVSYALLQVLHSEGVLLHVSI